MIPTQLGDLRSLGYLYQKNQKKKKRKKEKRKKKKKKIVDTFIPINFMEIFQLNLEI